MNPSFVQSLDQTTWARGMGLLSLGIILGFQRVAPKWRASCGRRRLDRPVGLLDLAARGVMYRRAAPGFPVPSLPARDLLSDIPLLFAAALGISLVAMAIQLTSGGFAGAAVYR